MSTSLTVGKSVVNSYNPYVTLTVTESATSATANTSTLTYSLVIYRPSSISSSASKAWSFSINGTSYSGTTTIGGSGSKTITSGTQTVSHSSDGTKSISLSLSFTFAITWSGTYMGTYSTSGTMTLTSLDRTAPTITITSTSSGTDSITFAATSNVSCNTWGYSTNGGSSYTTFNSGSATSVSKTISGLSVNTSYSLKVRAYKVSNNVVGTASATVATLGASSITSASAVTLSDDGTACEIVFTPCVSSYYFALTFTIGDYSVTTDRFTTGDTSAYTYTGYSFTTSEWAPYITDSTTGTCTATLTTYEEDDDDSELGSTTKTFNVYVPSDTKPTIDSVTFSEGAEDFPSAFSGVFVQGYSEPIITVEASGAYGSTIEDITVKFENTYYTLEDGTAQLAVLSGYGDLAALVTATDSRGKSTSATYYLTAYQYYTPTLYLTYSTTAETLAVTATGGVASVNGLNAATITFNVVAESDSSLYYDAEFDLENDGTDAYSQTFTISDDSAQTITWNITAVITDYLSSRTATATTGVTTMSFLAGGKGVTFFDEAEEEGVHVDGYLHLTKDEDTYNNVYITGMSGQQISFNTRYQGATASDIGIDAEAVEISADAIDITSTEDINLYPGSGDDGGDVNISGGEVYLTKSSSDTYYRAERTDTGTSIRFGIGSGGYNRGIYDDTDGEWMLYRDSSGYDHFQEEYIGATVTNGAFYAYKLLPHVWIGTGTWTTGTGTSLVMFTDTEINTHFTTGNTANTNYTYINAINRDGTNQSVHVEGLTHQYSTWYVVCNSATTSGDIQLNFIVIKY